MGTAFSGFGGKDDPPEDSGTDSGTGTDTDTD